MCLESKTSFLLWCGYMQPLLPLDRAARLNPVGRWIEPISRTDNILSQPSGIGNKCNKTEQQKNLSVFSPKHYAMMTKMYNLIERPNLPHFTKNVNGYFYLALNSIQRKTNFNKVLSLAVQVSMLQPKYTHYILSLQIVWVISNNSYLISKHKFCRVLKQQVQKRSIKVAAVLRLLSYVTEL